MGTNIHFAGFSGSLRKNSFNTKLLHNCLEVLPEGVTMNIVSIADLPLYNGDLDIPEVEKRPDAVTVFRDHLTKANGIVIVSPEYNYSIPGVLKNAIDWASRGKDSPLLHKPVVLMGATPGRGGTIRMQLAFHAVFQALDMHSVHQPEILISEAQSKFDGKGKLTDDKAVESIKKKLIALKDVISHSRKS